MPSLRPAQGDATGRCEVKTYLEPAEVALLEANALARERNTRELVPCLRDQLLIRLLFRLALRVSEALALGVEDCDLKALQVMVIRQKERLRLFCPECGERLARRHHHCPGCGKRIPEPVQKLQEVRRQRSLPLDTGTAQLLREFIEKGGPVLKDGRLLLFGITPARAFQVVRDAAQRAGLGKLMNPETGKEHQVSPHRLRDAFATHAASMDDSAEAMRLLQDYLGHTDFNTTARYIKLSGKRQGEWLDRLWQGKDATAKMAPGGSGDAAWSRGSSLGS